MQARSRAGVRDDRDGAPAPRRAETVTERVLALQRAAGNAAVGGMLQRSRLLARSPTPESMDMAFAEFGVQVPGANVFSFIVRLRSAGRLEDGGRGFTWSDFLQVIGTAQGKAWVKKKWLEHEGTPWGNQFIQGQHEWIKNDDVGYVIRTIVLEHGGANLDAWLSALESLRIPTADVAFKPRITPQSIAQANADPTGFSATTLGTFSGHVGAFYSPRPTPHPKDPERYAYRPETKGEKADFHTPLHKLLLTHLKAGTNDLSGFLKALQTFQSQKLWGGDIEGLEQDKAQQIPNDFRAKQTAGASLRGRYQSAYEEGSGVTTTFQEANSVADLQEFAREAKLRNEQIMERRINAILSMTQPQGIPQPLSNYRPEAPTEAPWIVDPGGKSVADYDREAGYDASALEPIGYGGDIEIDDDREPDEAYSQDTRPSTPGPTPAPQAFDNALVAKYGQQRSLVTQQLEQRFHTINAEVQRVTEEAFKATTKQLEAQVNEQLAAAPQDRKPAIIAWAHSERAAIEARYRARTRAPYDKCLAGKHALDLQLFAQEPTQTTTEAQQKLLEAYFTAVNQLLDVYVAELKAALAS